MRSVKELKIFVYGNPLLKGDSKALRVSKKISIQGVTFREMDTSEDFDTQTPVIMDVANTEKVKIVTDESQLKHPKLYSMHDFDLAFQIKIMKKAGLIKSFTIIALPEKLSEEKTLKQTIEAIKKLLPVDV
jgi:Ni,Fe-hydrogenase maturation factor